MHQFSDEFLTKWEHIINDVDITDLPLECIKKVVIRLVDNRQKTFNVQLLRKQGLDMPQIESRLHRVLSEFGDQVCDLDWTIDIKAVAEIVQPQTDKLLKDMK